jgi:hypothetical protein
MAKTYILAVLYIKAMLRCWLSFVKEFPGPCPPPVFAAHGEKTGAEPLRDPVLVAKEFPPSAFALLVPSAGRRADTGPWTRVRGRA